MPRNHLINGLHPVAAVYDRRRVLTKREDSAVTDRRYNMSVGIYAMASRTKVIIGHPERSRGRNAAREANEAGLSIPVRYLFVLPRDPSTALGMTVYSV